ncbi:hypothetical protein TNCV_4742701 [Trichonephila clavipes]|nr:hypothetical protein TNCV_4742701 [Trichonephila clavipes]
MQCLPPNVISTVAEETSKFAMKEPTFETKKETKQKEAWIPQLSDEWRPIPSAKIIIIIKYVLLRMALRFSFSDTMMEGPTQPKKKSSSPESLHVAFSLLGVGLRFAQISKLETGKRVLDSNSDDLLFERSL